MSLDSCNDYYQLCYNSDSSPVKDDDYKTMVDGEFPYKQYISSPKSLHNRHFYHDNTNIYTDVESIYADESCSLSPGRAIYSDLKTMTTMLQSSYLSDKLKKDTDTNKGEKYEKHFVEEAVSCLESLLSNDEETQFNSLGKYTETFEDLSDGIGKRSSRDSTLSNGSLSNTLINDDDIGYKNNAISNSVLCDSILMSNEELHLSNTSEIDVHTDNAFCNNKYFPDEDSSSSGVSSYSHSPSSSCTLSNSHSLLSNDISSNSHSLQTSNSNMLNVEIDRLKNITIKHSPDSYKRHSVPKVVNDAICENINLLEVKSKSMTCNTNTRSATPNGRKSPFFDIFKSKRNLDSDNPKQKNTKKLNKSVSCVTRSNSAFFCNFKKTNMKSVNLMEKHDSENRMESDIHDDMKIQHPSPFVRTIFQYVESSSVEDIFSSSNFSINDNNNVPVFTCGGMRNLQDSKFNSLSRKSKKNGIIRTMERGQHEPTLVSSGRRISENSDFYISIIAYLDRIRKAKTVSTRRRPRHRRYKSDPGDSISMFLSDNNSEGNQFKYKHRNNSSDQLAEVGLLTLLTATDTGENPWTLSKRFTDLQGNSDYKNFKSQFSSSDSAINHRFSLCEDATDNKKSFSRKSRSLRNISTYASKKKCLLMNEQSKRDSFDANKLMNYEDDSNENKEMVHGSENKETDQQCNKFKHVSRELFPEIEKNIMARRSACLENIDSQRIPPPRRSVFSENFDMPWPPSLLATSSPNEIKSWLDSQELGPQDRQKITEQLLLQLTQMGPSDNFNNDQSECTSSTDNLINSICSLNERNHFNGDSNVSKHNSFVSNGESGGQIRDCNTGYNKIKETNESVNSTLINEKHEKHNKTRKLFGSIRRNKSKDVDWNRMQYMNDAYDGDSIKRKGKSMDTKQRHDNQKVKRFSAIRSIFEPIKSPKSKKSWKGPIGGKYDRIRVPHHINNSSNNNNIKMLHTNDSGVDNDGLKNEEPSKRDVTESFDSTNTTEECSLPPMEMLHEKHIAKEEIDEKDIVKENCISIENEEQQHNHCIMENKFSCTSCEKSFRNKLFRKSKSIDSIPEESKFNELHRRTFSRSVDAIHELKKHTSFSAALIQDINDSGILHELNSNSPRKDVIEVYISNGFVKSNEDFEKENVIVDVEEVTSSEPNLNWSNKVSCLNGGCNHCHVSNKDVENSRIIVDVPHHLIPPEIASKSPIQSPNVRRKGLLKKSPCLQHSLSHGERGEKGTDFTSADSGLSLSDETDYTQPQYEKDITNFCLVKEPKHSVTVNLDSTKSSDELPLGTKSNQLNHNTRTNSLHKTEIHHRVDTNRVSDDNKNLPHIISFSRNHVCEPIPCKNEDDEQSTEHKIISPIRPKFKENICTSESHDVNTNTIKYQGQVHTNYSISNQKKENTKVELEFKTPSNTVSVARVLPFNKSGSHESSEESQPCDDECHPNSNNSGEMHLTRKPSVIWAIVKKMEVSLVIQRDYGDPEIIKIEDFNVRRVNTYKDVEELVVDTYMKHLQLLDKQHLDLDTFDIKYLQMAEHKVPIGSTFDLSLVKIEDSFLPCRLCMKDKESWSLASLSYDSLIPKSYLEKYVSLILSHHHAIFFGPSGTGKSYLAERIANLINYRMNEGTIPPIILKNATPERWRTLLTKLCAEKRERPFVIILDGFSQRFIDSDIDIYDIIKVCEEKDPKPYIICTMTITPNIEIPPKWQLNFRWIWLSNHEEPIDGLLQRYLRRKFIQFGNQHLQRESFRIADWLTSVWRHINTFLKKFTSTDCSIGPTMFYECPSDILEAEEWFVDLWNYSITPYILHAVKQGLKLHGARCEWEDPLTYILKSYPWVSEKVKKKMKLKRICMEDVDYSLHCHSEEEKQRLLDFLRQLEVMMFENVDRRKHPTSKGYRMESSL